MAQISAGILLYRGPKAAREVFLVHPGGPFWAKKDEGAWSIPKGLIDPGEDLLAAAKRELREETGFAVDGAFADLGVFRLPSGKRLHVWSLEHDVDPTALVSNRFEMVWPPRSGRLCRFAEVDRGAWFGERSALGKITAGQRPVLAKFFGADA